MRCTGLVVARIAEGVEPNDIGILARSSLPAWLHSLRPEFEAAEIPIAEAVDIGEILGRPAPLKPIDEVYFAYQNHSQSNYLLLLRLLPRNALR